MATWRASGEVLAEKLSATATPAYESALTASEEAGLPNHLRDWLGRLRLLYGVPFAYLTPNEKLLPKESIRFFYIDRNWTDRLVDGALSVGKTTTQDYAHHHAVKQMVVTGLDNEERVIRNRLRLRDEQRGEAQGADLTGLLLRSTAVSGWPGLEVKAYKHVSNERADPPRPPTSLTLLRMERLGPEILLCIFNDIPERVDIEEPREGIQFGVDLVAVTRDAPSGFQLKLRHTQDQPGGGKAGEEVTPPRTVSVPVRKNSRRVIHVGKLKEALKDALSNAGDIILGDFTSAELAVEMLQFPYRQRFEGAGAPAPGGGPVFDPGTVYTRASFQIKVVTAPLTNAEMETLFPALGPGNPS